MKQYIIAFVLAGAHRLPGHAQTVQTMTEQLAVLHTLQQGLQKGYTLVTHGLQVIGDDQDGEYHLHITYFNSLLAVNPNIYSPSKQSHAQNYDNADAVPADSSRQAPNSSGPH